MLRRPALLALAMGAALLGPGSASADHGSEAVMLEGTLELTHSDDFRRGDARFYYALREGRRHTPLHFGRWRADLRDGMRIQVRGTMAEGRVSVEQVRRLKQPAARTFAATGPGPRRVAVLLVNFSNDTSQPYTPAQAASTMFTGPASVSAYFQEESFGTTSLSGDTFGWYTLPATNSGCAVDVWAQAANAAATAAGVNLGSYQHVVYAFPYASSCGWAGLASMPGSRVWINGAFNLRVLGHELTHNLGVHHAGTLSCTQNGARVAISASCSSNEYGDPFDIMGSSSRHTSNWHKGQIGWLDPQTKQTVTASGAYTIAPQEWQSPGVQALRIQRGTTGNYFYLEFRRPYGTSFDTFSVTDPAVNGVSIRMAPDYPYRQISYLIDTNTATTTFSDAPLTPGKTFTDETYGISIQTTNVSATGATVQITLGGAPPPPPPADTTAPAAPGTLSSRLRAGPTVALTWGTASDNVGVTGYRVYRGGAELGTTTAVSYSDAAPPAGATVSYSVRAFDAAGNLGPASNSVSLTIPGSPSPPGDKPPTKTGAPRITGAAQQGSTLTASPGTWAGTTPMTFAFRWMRCDGTRACTWIAGATASTYRVSARDVGKTVRAVVTAKNGKGSASAMSAASPTVKRFGAATSRVRDGWDATWAAADAPRGRVALVRR